MSARSARGGTQSLLETRNTQQPATHLCTAQRPPCKGQQPATFGSARRNAPAQAATATADTFFSRIASFTKPKKLPGSAIPARKSIRLLKWVRRFAQVFFFALFMYFLFQTAFRGSFAASADQVVRLPLPVEAYLLADPFVSAMTALSTHTVYRGLLWSVGLLALTLVFGRVFCGWICPFGTLHHFFGWLLPLAHGPRRVARRGEQDAHLPARQILPALRVPPRGDRGQRDRWDVRPHLHRGPLDRARRDPSDPVPHRTWPVGHGDARPVARPSRRPQTTRKTSSRGRCGKPTSRTFIRRG